MSDDKTNVEAAAPVSSDPEKVLANSDPTSSSTGNGDAKLEETTKSPKGKSKGNTPKGNAGKKRKAPLMTVEKGVVPEGYTAITEGSATILSDSKGQAAFYNEVQIKNRDLSTLVLNEYARQLEAEAIDQIELKRRGEPHLRMPATWNTWGRTTKSSTQTPVEIAQYEEELAKATNDEAKAKLQRKIDQGKELYDDTGKPGTLEGMRVLEALAASGLRSIRYAREVVEGVGLDHIVVNDLEANAVEAMRANITFNGLDGKDSKLRPTHGDAVMQMYQHRIEPADAQNLFDKTRVKALLKRGKNLNAARRAARTYDVIDLDPYGSPAIFIDSAVQAVREGGLLCVTATDLSTLVGKNADNCFAKYRSMPLKLAPYGHEMAIRILLSYIEGVANKYDRHIVPIMSVHMDFYVRVFIRVYSSKFEVKNSSLRLGMVYHATCGDSFWIQPMGRNKVQEAAAEDDGAGAGSSSNEQNPNTRTGAIKPPYLTADSKCSESGGNVVMGGPIWSGPIHNKAFVRALLNHFKRPAPNGFEARALGAAELVHGVVDAVHAELETPLYYSIPNMSKLLHVTMPATLMIHSALYNAGYKVSQAHSNPTALKTDAPPHIVWDVMRAWFKKHPSKREIEDPCIKRLIEKEPTITIDFTIAHAIRQKLRKTTFGPARYKANPKKHWGPKAAAPGSDSRQTHRRPDKRQKTDHAERPSKGGKMHLFNL